MTSSIREPQNYPNPFARSTQISFDVPQSSFVKVAIYDIMGRLIQVIHNNYMEAGSHTFGYDSNALESNGKYLIVVQSGNVQTSHWMTLSK